jgi:hypothetical protein
MQCDVGIEKEKCEKLHGDQPKEPRPVNIICIRCIVSGYPDTHLERIKAHEQANRIEAKRG